MIEMLRIYSKDFFENGAIEQWTPYSIHHAADQARYDEFSRLKKKRGRFHFLE
jgi:hypothetical protein